MKGRPVSLLKRGMRLALIILLTAALFLLMSYALLLWQGDRWLRPLIERELQQYLVPQLSLSAPLRWRLLPTPALTLSDSVLLTEDGQSLMAVHEAAFAPDFAALLEGQLVLQDIRVSGVTLTVERLADGAWNVAHWLRRVDQAESDADGEMPVIRQVRIYDATVHVLEPWRLTLEIPVFEAGPVAPDIPGRLSAQLHLHFPDVPPDNDRAKSTTIEAAAAEMQLSAAYQWQRERIEFDEMAVKVGAELGEERNKAFSAAELRIDRLSWGFDGQTAIERPSLNGELTLPSGDAADQIRLEANCEALYSDDQEWRVMALAIATQGQWHKQAWSAHLSAPAAVMLEDRWEAKAMTLSAEAHDQTSSVQFKASGEAGGNLSAPSNAVDMLIRQSELSVPHPADSTRPLKVEASGEGRIDIAQKQASGRLRGGFEDSRFEGQWNAAWRGAVAAKIVASLDRLDLDRYLAPAAADNDDSAVDLGMWRDWPLDIDATVGELLFHGFTSHATRLRLQPGTEGGAGD